MWLAVPNMSGRPVGTPLVIAWQQTPSVCTTHMSTVGCMGCLCSGCPLVTCICLLTPAEDFRERCSNYRAVLELFQKASKELECVMKRESACMLVWCRCVRELVYWVGVAVEGCVFVGVLLRSLF